MLVGIGLTREIGSDMVGDVVVDLIGDVVVGMVFDEVVGMLGDGLGGIVSKRGVGKTKSGKGSVKGVANDIEWKGKTCS